MSFVKISYPQYKVNNLSNGNISNKKLLQNIDYKLKELSEEELNKLEKELATYKQQSDSLLSTYNNEQLSPEERKKAGQEYNKVNEVAKQKHHQWHNAGPRARRDVEYPFEEFQNF